MLLRRRLEPKPFHALFFPDRKEGAVLIGSAELVWIWSSEEFKHVDLADFDLVVSFSEAPNNSPAKTSDNLPCSAKATFWLRPRTDAEAMKAVTQKFAASKDLSAICGVEHFKSSVRAELRAIVQRAVAEVSFIDLLSDASTAKRIDASVKKSCDELIKRNGFDLILFDTQVEVIKPSDSAFSEALRIQWDEYQQRKAKLNQDELRRQSDAKFEEEKLKIEVTARLGMQTSESAVETQKAIDTQKEAMDKLVTAQKKSELEQARERDRVSGELAKLNDDAERRNIQYHLELDKFDAAEKIKNEKELNVARHESEIIRLQQAAKIAELTRLEEEGKRKEIESHLQHQLAIARLNSDLAGIENGSATARAELIEKIGLAEAKVKREQEIARQAGDIAVRDALLKALPEILAKSSAPAERMAEIRYLHLGNQSEPGVNSGMNSTLLGAVSTLPLVKEVLAFIRDWDGTAQPAKRTAQTDDLPNEQHKTKSAGN